MTLVIVTGATVLTVGYMNYRSARATLDTIETHIRQSIARKGQGLATNHALALRGLVADNAFGDVARLIERSVREDDEMLYGLFLGADGRVWTYVPPLGWSAMRAATPTSGSWASIRPPRRGAGAEASQARGGRAGGVRVLRRPSPPTTARCWAASSTACPACRSSGRCPPRARSSSARCCSRSACCPVLGVAATLLGITIIRGVAARITRPLAHLTEVTTAIADGRKNQRVSISTDDEIGDLGQRLQPDAAGARRVVQEPRID